MATVAAKVEQNVAGKFYVDRSCIYCGLCDATAPMIFREYKEWGWAYVYHQPSTPEELRLAIEAKESCPTESIGMDGE